MLGCRLRPDGQPTRALRRRVALAIELYQDGRAPLLFFAGGGGEAEAMREMAIAAGVPAAALACETQSRNTAENARCSARLLRRRGLGRIVLVSHRVHLFRARLLFRLAGISVTASAGVPARSKARALLLLCYEAGALPRSLVRMLPIFGLQSARRCRDC